MKKTFFNFILLSLTLTLTSCLNKTKKDEASIGQSVNTVVIAEKSFDEVIINEKSCIDAPLAKELESGESIKKLVVNSDVDFCNGVRVRLKTYQFSSKKYKAFGFVRSNSGHESCISESEDFTRTMFLGDRGVLVGDKVKILLGGHQFNSDNKLVPSEHRLARYVKFEWGSYQGEMGFIEKGKLRCWAIQ